MMIIILISLSVSFVALLVFLAFARSRSGLATVAALSVVGAFFSLVAFSVACFLHMVATFVVAIICLVCNPRRSIVMALLIAAPFVAYATAIYIPLSELNRLALLRREYPLKSLAQRLAYEHQGAAVRNVSADLQLSPAAESQLVQFEQRDAWNQRRGMLANLHDHSRDDFILATGFGPVRMMEVYREPIVLEDGGTVSLADGLASRPDPESSRSSGAGLPAVAASPQKPLLSDLHDTGSRDFLDPGRFGYVRDIDHVAGFQSHRFTKMPKPADDPQFRWTLVRLELIGLLKYDQPKAYVSENLPRLDELGEAATRDVDNFEQAAFERLQTDEDLVIDEAPGRIRMVGSLRAGKDCLECHSVHRGALIGALTYTIVPVEQAVPAPLDQARLDHRALAPSP